MTEARHILAIDQGTTSTRAIVFDSQARPVATAQKPFEQYYPASGWVEHDAEEIWTDTVAMCRQAVAEAGLSFADIAGIGITNQRETVVVWDRNTGEPIHRAIVWQDRRTAAFCRRLAADGYESLVQQRSGLLLDPYFSGTKLNWLLHNVPDAQARAQRGELCFGTVDSFLLWRLTGGRVHATDATNASRTMLFDIHRQAWDDELLRMLDVPAAMLPTVLDSSTTFGTTDPELFGAAVPVAGIAGDQQAATVGQACFEPGMAKSSYGTGCFLLLNTGPQPVLSRNRLLTTVAYRLQGQPVYALEGAIFVAGAAVQWLRDNLGLIKEAGETAELATSVADSGGVYMVPAFTGLGAPHWDPDARGALLGLTRGSTRAHIARATLESVSYQTYDLTTAMRDDAGGAGLGTRVSDLRVDGGMVANDWFCQNLADILALPVERPQMIETTVLGAAFLAGLEVGLYPGLTQVAQSWQRDRLFRPGLGEQDRQDAIAGWRDAVARVRSGA